MFRDISFPTPQDHLFLKLPLIRYTQAFLTHLCSTPLPNCTLGAKGSHHLSGRQGRWYSNYHLEMTKILSDTETYVCLPKNPTSDFKKALVDLIDTGSQLGILYKKERSYLLPVAPRIPIIYYLPKVHKDAKRPLGRPIISDIDSVTSRIGCYIDFYLQPIVKSIPLGY